MFKKLCLVLTIALSIAVGGAWAAEEGQECTVPAGSKIFMMASTMDPLPVKPNRDINVTVDSEITEDLAKFFTKESTKYGIPMEWAGAHVAKVYDGKIIVVRDVDLKACK